MNKPDLKVDWCSYEAAKYAVEHWHYSKCLPVGKLVKVGVWEKDVFIGVVIFGRGANKSLGSQFGLSQTQSCELVRVALDSHSNTVSRIIKISLILVKKFYPKIKLIVSFADKEQNHHGGIYQAGNWIYNGETNAADEYLYKGKRWHGRAFRKSHGSHLKYMDKGLKIVKGSTKHRYLMPLDKQTKKEIMQLSQPYPKRTMRGLIEEQQIPSVDGGASPTSTLQTKEIQNARA